MKITVKQVLCDQTEQITEFDTTPEAAKFYCRTALAANRTGHHLVHLSMPEAGLELDMTKYGTCVH